MAMTRGTLVEGVQATAAVLSRVRRSASPLDDLGTIGRIVGARQSSLEAYRRRTAQELTGNIKADVITRLQRMPLEKARVSDMVTSVGERLDDDWWMVERAVRTETGFAYNLAQADGIALLDQDPEFRGGIWSRWTEMINDLTGAPFDKKVGDDSKALHGQLVRPGGVFTMPSGRGAPSKLIGATWSHPPNRPNCRGILTPWMSGWGVPGWVYRGEEALEF
jgi:hypothetical protein